MALGRSDRRASVKARVESAEERSAREMDEIAGTAPARRPLVPLPRRASESRRPRIISGLRTRNVGGRERAGSVLLGSALMAAGLRRRGAMGTVLAVVGGTLVARGASGRCPVYAGMGRSTARVPNGLRKQHGPNAVLDASDAVRVEHQVTIDRPVEELWAYWRRLENLPRIMRHLEEVSQENSRISRWTARGPAGTRINWRARIINELPNELLAWKSLEDSDVANAGSVHFTPGPDGTTVRVLLEYAPPAGRLGAAVASLLGDDPDRQVQEDLENFRRAMEAGQLPRIREREVGVQSTREPSEEAATDEPRGASGREQGRTT